MFNIFMTLPWVTIAIKDFYGSFLRKINMFSRLPKGPKDLKKRLKGLLGSLKDMLLERKILFFLLRALSAFKKPKV